MTDIPMPTPTINPPPHLSNTKIISFDVYGTLIRYKSHILDSFSPLLSRLPSSSKYLVSTPLSTTIPNSATVGQIEFLKLFQKTEDSIKLELVTSPRRFDAILHEIWRRVAHDLDVSTTDEEANAFGNEENIASWPVFDGTIDALKKLVSKGLKLVALSNVDRYAWDISAKATGLDGVKWYRVFTAEDFKGKPEMADEEKLRTLMRFAEEGGFWRDEVLHVAQSLGHDHAPAKKVGVSSVFLIGDGPVWGKEEESRVAVEKGLVGYGWRFENIRKFVKELDRVVPGWGDCC